MKGKEKRIPEEMGERMRTNIPHGINQTNRAHPFFIVLRQYAEMEEQMYQDVIKWLMIIGVFTVAEIAKIFFSGMYAVPTSILMGLHEIWWAMYFVFKLPPNLVFPKVNKMIYSDDYSGAILNYENVFNMVALANDNIGEMRHFIMQQIIIAIATGVSAVIYIIYYLVSAS